MRGSGAAPVKAAPEKSKPGCCADGRKKKGGEVLKKENHSWGRQVCFCVRCSSPFSFLLSPFPHLALEPFQQQALALRLGSGRGQGVVGERARPGLARRGLGQLEVEGAVLCVLGERER